MKITYIYPIIVLILAVIIIPTNWITSFLFFFPIIISLVLVVKIIQYLISSEATLAAVTFLLSLMMLMISLKLNYVYYNSIVVAMLIGLSLWLYRKLSLCPKFYIASKALLCVVLINLVLLLTPNELIMEAQVPDEYIAWKPNLTFDDFTTVYDEDYQETADTLEKAAAVQLSFYVKVNSAYNYPPALVVACLDKTKSYKKHYVRSDDWRLLLHEQVHFNINQYFAAMANDSLSKLWGGEGETLKSVINTFHKKVATENDLYDSITNHGLDTVQQRVWTEKYKIN